MREQASDVEDYGDDEGQEMGASDDDDIVELVVPQGLMDGICWSDEEKDDKNEGDD